MKRKLYVAVWGMSLLAACSAPKTGAPEWFENAVKTSDHQLLYMAEQLKDVPDTACFPRSTKADGSYRLENAKDWTSGFYPGSMWLAYELSGDEALAKEARRYTDRLEDIQYYTGNHDIGFMMYCSYGNALRLKPEPKDKEILINSSESLCARFSPEIGLIRSWDFGDWSYPVIIDNMMNLEMLFWAAKNGGNPYLYDIAVSHADKTMICQFRPDYTSYHVAVYDTITGNLIKGVTHQGYADSTMWARGQAWAIYGYTVVYRETKDPKYLDFAQKVTDVYLERLPEDKVPYWDFSAPGIPDAPRDASAAAVVASALLELSTYLPNGTGKRYKDAAIEMLASLNSDSYQSGKSKPSFLLHSVGHWPAHSEIDASIIYADYYYIEALLRLKRLQEGKNVIK